MTQKPPSEPWLPKVHPGCRFRKQAQGRQLLVGAGPCGDPCPQQHLQAGPLLPAGHKWMTLPEPAAQSSLSHCPPSSPGRWPGVAGPGRKLPGHCPQLFAMGVSTGKGQPRGAWTLSRPERPVGGLHLHFKMLPGRRLYSCPRERKGHCSESRENMTWRDTGRCGPGRDGFPALLRWGCRKLQLQPAQPSSAPW